MSGFREPGFADRQKAAAEARKNLLNKFKSQPAADDPAVLARAAERKVQAEQREREREARQVAKAEQKRLEEEAAREAALQAERDKEAAIAAEAAMELERKAARDARYAARKARQK